MLAFLHTAQVHVDNFERLSKSADVAVPLCHVVREDLLAHVQADGQVALDVTAAVQAEVTALVDQGARVVVCTCSTLGSSAEATPVGRGARVLRVDRPLAERVVQSGQRILVVAATPSAMGAAIDLLHSIATQAHLAQLSCGSAWERFLAGDQVGYATRIAELVEAHALSGDQVMLAQASMAPALSLIRRQDIEVSASPAVGVQTALALYRLLATD